MTEWIGDCVHALMLPFEIPDPSGRRVPRFVNAFMIQDDEICLVDSGVAHSEKMIFSRLDEMGLEPDITQLVLTHSHPDHLGAARAIKEASGCLVLAHEAERGWIEDPELQFSQRPVPGFHDLVGGGVEVDRTIGDGDIIRTGKKNLRVIHTPGHSKGSVCLFMEDEGVLFSGDAVPVPGDMPIYDDFQASVASIQRLISLDGVDVLLSAWDGPKHGADVRRALSEGLCYLMRIHEAVEDASAENPSKDSTQICRAVVERLGLPEFMANPLVARSLQSNLASLRR